MGSNNIFLGGSVMRKIYYLFMIGLVFVSCTTEKKLQNIKGLKGIYRVDAKNSIQEMTSLEISFPGIELVNGKEAVWFQMKVFAGEKQLYGLAMLVPSLDFLYPCGQDVDVFRYCLFPGNGRPLEFKSRSTGKASLPKMDFFKKLLPHASDVQDPDMPLFQKGTYLGHTLYLIGREKEAVLLPLDKVKLLDLDTDVLIGTSRSFRDDMSGRKYPPASEWSVQKKDYTYVPLTKTDYSMMMDAGMNIFRVPLGHLPWIIEEPVFFLVRKGFKNMPELLYRSNFYGAVMYMDEPAIRAMAFEQLLRDFKSPQKAATLVVELTRGRYEGTGGYGKRNLDLLLRQAGYNFGDMEILQPDYPVWETVPSSAWYEFEAGISGWCLEGRYNPGWFAGLIKSELGVDFPDDTLSCIKFHHAFFTGAARRFGSKWGVAIYGQMDLKAAELVFPMAYEQGAHYFWFWTSDHAHHVPFEEQLEHTRNFRAYIQLHPRKTSAKNLTAQAKVAVALPWGYLCDHYQMKHYTSVDKTFSEGRMWWSTEMELSDKNSKGVPYRDVLAAAVKEAVELLKSGTPFDFIFLRNGEKTREYEEVRRVFENAGVVIE